MNYKAQTIKILFKIIDFRIKQNWNNWERKGIVKSVDETKRTCIVTIDGLDYTDISLQGINGLTTGFVQIPAVNSQVVVNKTGEFYYVSLFSQINKLICDTDSVQFNHGNIGLPKADVIKTESEKDKAIIDALLQILTGSPINEPGNGSPSALQLALKTALTGKQSGVWTSIQNTKITQ